MRLLTLLLLCLSAALPAGANSVDGVWKARVKKHPKLINTTHTTLAKGTLLTIDNSSRCMDNTPAYYYFAGATTNAMVTTWLIYLPGKAWCFSAASCFLLAFWEAGAATSKKVPSSISLDGAFSPDPTKNPWAGANLGYLGYCSGDAFLGSTNQTALGGYNYQGRRILRAFFTHLVTVMGMGRPYRVNNQEAVHQIVLMGGGTGGIGVLLNIDDVAGWMLELGVIPGDFELRGVLDDALNVPVLPLHPPPGATTVTPPLTAAALAIPYLNVTAAQLSPQCLAANSANPSACLFPPTRLKYVTSPVLVYAPLYDKRQLHTSFGSEPPASARELTGAESAAAAQLRSDTLTALAATVAGSVSNAAFAPACVKGPVALHPTFWGVRLSKPENPDLESFRDIYANWVAGGNLTNGKVFADTCTSYACGTGCRRNAGHPRNPDKLIKVDQQAVPKKSVPAWVYRWTFRFTVVLIVIIVLNLAWKTLAPMMYELPPLPLPLPDRIPGLAGGGGE